MGGVMENIDFKCGFIGIGLGGSNIAQSLHAKLGGEIGFINLSKQDLSTVTGNYPKENVLLLDSNGYGAGKNRAEGAKYFNRSIDAIKDLGVRIASNAELLFVCASTSGGTGSGLIPRVTAYFYTEEFNDAINANRKTPIIVFTIAATPDFDEGVKSMINTLDCLEDFSLMVEKKKIGRFLLINNDYGRNEKTQAEKYARINEGVANILTRYLKMCGHSKEGVLDKADRIASLSVPGIHSFFYFDDSKGKHESPFIQPEGARVLQVATEIPEGTTFAQYIDRFGLVVDDMIQGFYSKEENLIPIVHLAGFNNWGKLTERFRNQLELKKARSNETAEVNLTQGSGLNDIKEQKKFIESEYSVNKISDINDIVDIFDK